MPRKRKLTCTLDTAGYELVGTSHFGLMKSGTLKAGATKTVVLRMGKKYRKLAFLGTYVTVWTGPKRTGLWIDSLCTGKRENIVQPIPAIVFASPYIRVHLHFMPPGECVTLKIRNSVRSDRKFTVAVVGTAWKKIPHSRSKSSMRHDGVTL